jgi:hypothetical protein
MAKLKKASQFPARYEPRERLGKGGGGEVWAARDRVTGRIVALKLLPEGADAPEMLALVREATALSGIEGLGVPQVLHFGRLPKSQRAYMVRELVEGKSLADIIEKSGDTIAALSAIAQAADLVTRLHRALLLHGDIKPANIIVGSDGTATLVDLGLAAHWREGGAKPEGLTPRYAAPELFMGEPLTPRAEVFALGASAGEVLGRAGVSLDASIRKAVQEVVEKATGDVANERYPSADEFAQALRKAAKLRTAPAGGGMRVWSIVGIDEVSADLLERVRELNKGAGLVVSGLTGSGRSTLVRRLAWSLGVEGVAVGLIESREEAQLETALAAVLTGRKPDEVVIIIDDADKRSSEHLAKLDALREQGATLVMVVASGSDAAELVQRMIPSLSEQLVAHVVKRTGRLPGLMRALVSRLEGEAVVSTDDVERRVESVPIPLGVKIAVAEIHRLLDRGRFDHAADYLAAYDDDDSVMVAIARAKLCTGRGQSREALQELKRVEGKLAEEGEEFAVWHVEKSRAHLRAGDYEEAELHASMALTRLGASLLGDVAAGKLSAAREGDTQLAPLIAQALAVSGLVQSLSARPDEAVHTLRRATTSSTRPKRRTSRRSRSPRAPETPAPCRRHVSISRASRASVAIRQLPSRTWRRLSTWGVAVDGNRLSGRRC